MKSIAMTVVAIGVSMATAQAEELTVPHVFKAGTPAKAAEINDNFAAIYRELNAIKQQLGNGGGGAISCAAIHAESSELPSGVYTIQPSAAIEPFEVYCDMETDGGGWTIVYATDGGDNEQPMTGDVTVSGNPLAFEPMNLNRTQKMAISAVGTEGIFVRNDGAWMRVTHALFDAGLATANNHAHYAVTITAHDGAIADGFIGYSNFNISGGGDYNVSMTDGSTGNGRTTTQGVDHHSNSYYHLNAFCKRHYLYSYSNQVADSDASYQINTGLGTWTATAECASAEGDGMAFYAAVR